MISIKKRGSGFTVVELLVVIVVIAILVSIVMATHSGIQVKTRNNQRQLDIQYLQTQLETYASQNGHYPSLTDLNNASWRSKNMSGFSSGKMLDPSSSQTGNMARFASAPAAKIYSYQVSDSSGKPCESDDTNCAQYTLAATYQGTVNGASTYVKKNED